MTPLQAQTIASMAKHDRAGAEFALFQADEKVWRWWRDQTDDSRLSEEGQAVMAILRPALSEDEGKK